MTRPSGAWGGRAAAAGVLAALALPLAALAARAGGWAGLGASDWAALRFTLGQAAVSALLSVALAVPVARALARRAFPGRAALVTLLGAPFILPVIVAALGLVALLGREGPVNAALGWAGWGPVSIYGPHGVVAAHVFLNMPLATRLLLQGWAEVPGERMRLAASLGFTAADTARLIERPMLRAVAPGVLAVIFLVCATSFAIALALGGGPRATTMELAIYQAFRFDFDLGRVVALGALQLAIGAAALAASLRLAPATGPGAGLDRTVPRWDSGGGWLRAQDALAVGLAAAFLLGPMALVLGPGAWHLADLPAAVWAAAARSLAIGAAAGLATAALALAMAHAACARGGGLVEGAGTLPVAASPLVLAAGLYLLVLPWADPVALALPVTALVNVLLALPFALRALLPAMRDLERDHGRLAASLGLRGTAWIRLVALPRLRAPLGFAAGLAAALAAGDLGAIALFAAPDHATLPLVVQQLMGAYRMDEAGAAALLLVALSLGLFAAFERVGRDARA